MNTLMLKIKVGEERIKEKKKKDRSVIDNKVFSPMKPTVLRWGKLPVMLSFATA